MTTLRKLSIAITFALGIQFSAGAYFHEDPFFHDIDRKNAESTLVINFTQDLFNQNSIQAQEIATWVENRASREWGNYNGTPYDVTWYPESIVHIVTNNNLTEQSKLTLLSEMITKQKNDNRKRATQRFVSDLCAGALCVGACGLLVWAIIEDMKNQRSRVEPGVTVTWKYKKPVCYRLYPPNVYLQTPWYQQPFQINWHHVFSS